MIPFLSELSNEQIKDQMLQLLGYSVNLLAVDKFDFASFVANFSDILNEHVSPQFCTSLSNSLDCIALNKNYMHNIINLKGDNKDSFVLSFISSKNGLFPCLFYKSGQDFKCVLVNKSQKCSLETYTIPNNKIGIICSYLGIENTPVNDLEHPHDILKQYTKTDPEINVFNIDNTYQSPFIDIENALKYAYSNTHFPKSSFGFPMDNISIYIKYLKNIANECPALEEYITNLTHSYSSNELFRNFCLDNPRADFLNMKNQFTKNFSSNLKESLRQLDMQNLKDNLQFFSELCSSDNNLRHFKAALDSLTPFLNEHAKNTQNFNEIGFICRKYFPNVINQLNISYAEDYFSMANEKLNMGDSVNALRLYGKCLALNPNHALCYYKRGNCFCDLNLFEQAHDCFSKASKLCPNSAIFKYNNAFTLYKLGKNISALIECNEILLSNPTHKEAQKLRNLLMVEPTHEQAKRIHTSLERKLNSPTSPKSKKTDKTLDM